MEYLSKEQESFCENAGLFGALISLTCLVQHMVFMLPNWITYAIIGVYILSIVSFILLAKKNATAPLLLVISAVLILLLEVFMTLAVAFSLVLVLLLVYLVVIDAVLYIGGTAKQLKKRSTAIKEEAAHWDNLL
jgi:flagellar biosynthesis protein FlhB